MNIIGLVAEYNPFHNGHKYQIDKIKEMYPDSLIIVVVSNLFTQRGEMSLLNVWDKALIAIENNVDLVVELPSFYAIQSSDVFAKGAIEILSSLHIDTLVFGSETDANILKQVAQIQETNNFDNILASHIKEGLSYPMSLDKTIKELLGFSISSPNDLLGVSYIKEVKKYNKNINIISIKRTNDYHDLKLNSSIVSASNIREKLNNNKNIKKYLPLSSYKLIKDTHLSYDKYFYLLKYKILTSKDLSIYLDVIEGLDNKLHKEINIKEDVNTLITSLKSKRYTYNKLSRMLLHILLSLTSKETKELNNTNIIRIIGFNNKGKNYLNKIKKNVSLPIISKYIKGNKILEFETRVSSIYDLINKTNNLSL
ncbi:MAG: nucleotidyltransferase, partial [Bacilli bacterium]